MYTDYAYIKLGYLRWAVTRNGQSLVYVNVTQNGHLEHVPDCVSSAIVAGQRLKTFGKRFVTIFSPTLQSHDIMAKSRVG